MEFILFGAKVWFWVAIGILLLISVVSEAREDGTYSFWGFVGLCVALFFWGPDWFKRFWEHISWTWPLIYLGIGIIFAISSIIVYGLRNKPKIKAEREKYAQRHKLTLPLTEEQENEFRDTGDVDRLIKPRDFQDDVTRWWLNWPGSFVYWLFEDFFVNLGEYLYSVTKRFFWSIYNAALGINGR